MTMQNDTQTADTQSDAVKFEVALTKFLEGAQKKVDDYWVRSNFTHAQSPLLSIKIGKKYVKIIRQDRDKAGKVTETGRSVHAFIDSTNGDVLKPASWAAPAKHARGNIYKPDNGVGCMNEYGPAYLR